MENIIKTSGSSEIKLDQTFLPDFWNDETRMNQLFAPFRVRNLNPINYDNKMKVWKEVIFKYCTNKGSSQVTINQLGLAMVRGERKPYVFPEVLHDMHINNEVQTKSSFLELPQNSWSGWAVNSLIKKPILWGLNSVKNKMFSTPEDENTEYIVRDAVQLQANKVRAHFETVTETIMSFSATMEKSTEIGLTLEGAHLAIHYLELQRKIIVDRTNSTTDLSKILIKFASVNQQVTPISQIEMSIYNLKSTEKVLSEIVDQLEQSIRTLDEKCRAQLKEGKRNLAKSTLRRKHHVEKNLQKRTVSLEHIEELLNRIHEVTHDKHILESYKIGTATLKSVLTDSGITLDNVDDVLAEVHEVIELHDDIQGVLGESKINADEEAELEKELEDLLTFNNDNDNVNKPDNKEDNKEEDLDASLLRRLDALKTDFDKLSTEEHSSFSKFNEHI